MTAATARIIFSPGPITSGRLVTARSWLSRRTPRLVSASLATSATRLADAIRLRFQGLLQQAGKRRDAGRLVRLGDEVPQQRRLVRADGSAQRGDPVGEIGRRRADERAQAAGRGHRGHCPPLTGEYAGGQAPGDAVEAGFDPLGRVGARIGTGMADAEVGARMGKHPPPVHHTGWQLPLHRPEPVDQPDQHRASRVPGKADALAQQPRV